MEFGEVKKQEEQCSITAIASDKTLGSVSMGFSYIIVSDDAEKFTSEMHDPCAHSRYLQKRTKQEHLQKAPVWSRPNTLRRLSQKYFYNSRVLERSQSRVPLCEEDVGAFIVVRSCLLFL